MTVNDILLYILIEECLAQKSSGKLPPITNGNKNREPQPDITLLESEKPWNTHS